MNILTVEGLTKKFGETKAVDDVTLSLQGGEVYALIGPNGSGKTTQLSLLASRKRNLPFHDSPSGILSHEHARQEQPRPAVSRRLEGQFAILESPSAERREGDR